MGTRGCYGFYRNGENKLTYNHFDSDPCGLGANIVDFVKTTSVEEMNQIFERITFVGHNIKGAENPSSTQIAECKKLFYVDPKLPITWYEVLRNTQGKLQTLKEGLRYMIDNQNFMKDSSLCEWAYVINLDTNSLEIYTGFQKEPEKNRYYAPQGIDGYYNVAYVCEFDVRAIPKDWMQTVYDIVDNRRGYK